MGQFGVGQGLRRLEDVRLLTGQGSYSDDFSAPGQVYGTLVRSPHAHAEILSIDGEDAKAAPGVLAVYTAADLSADGIGDIPLMTPIPGRDGKVGPTPPNPVLARGRVRHVGDPVAFVVAETPHQARDAAEQILVDYRELPAVIDTAEAQNPDAPQVWDEAPGNLCLDWEMGDAEATEAVFEKAAHITRLRLVNNRVVVNSMEPRVALAEYDAEAQRFTLTTPSQGWGRLRGQLAEQVFKVAPEQIRILTPEVGGGFGMKIFLYTEQVMVMYAARKLGRPVRWTSDRSEAFLSDTQARDHVTEAELALDADGKMLAIRVLTTANLGAYLSNFSTFIPTSAGASMLCGLYTLKQVYNRVACVFTNTVPVDAYRGAGRPEAAYVVERLVDAAAQELGMAPEELRRRNFIPSSALPYETVTGFVYDSGEFERMMDEVLRLADQAGFPARQAEAHARGRLRGMGIASYAECCGGIGMEDARVRLDADGGLTLIVGTQTNGQGHATAYAQLLADRFGLEPEMIRTSQGDSEDLPEAGGTGGSRSLLMGGMAIQGAADKAVERMKALAGHLLEAAPADIEFDAGEFRIVGTDRRISLKDVAGASHGGDGLPPELAGPIDEHHHVDTPPMTYPNGCHACELEVDPETGVIRILRYVIADDFGKLVNPRLVAGQVHGGTAQGLGQALLERTVYDAESGQLLSGSLMDYCLPRADDLPEIELHLYEVPCTTNPLGVKGAGEAGAIGAPPAIMNALVDALRPLGVTHIDMPATPERVWQAIRNAGANGKAAA